MDRERSVWDRMKSDGTIIFVKYGTGMVTFGADAVFVGKITSRSVIGDYIVIPATFKINVQHEVLNAGKQVSEVIYFHL
jgi:hypothetical protein